MTNPKRFSTLQALAALAGVDLRAIRNDAERWTFYLTAGALTQELPTLDHVEHWRDRFTTNTEATSEA
jgi:hypothetical protein